MLSAASAGAASTAPIVTLAGGRATIRLNRARERNRIELEDLATLRQAFTHVNLDPDIRVLVLTGTDESFSSGYAGGQERRTAPRFGLGKIDEASSDDFEHTVDQLAALRVPSIAALNGSVYGGSTDLALACDFRIGVDGMRLLMPAARLGTVYYPSGIERCVARLGVAAAKKLFLTAQPIDAPELLHIGYLDGKHPLSAAAG
jgi:enoyl-CoA hydratase